MVTLTIGDVISHDVTGPVAVLPTHGLGRRRSVSGQPT